jgi:nucleotide-binding universal stress UspA family protein
MFNRVLVGIDEQSRGVDAIALATRLVAPRGKLIFGHVHTGYTLRGKGSTGEFEAIEEQTARALLDSVIAESGVEAEPCCIGADRIGSGLHGMAEATGADLLVLGSSREGQNGRVWLRDGVRNAINGAPCAVVVAPLEYTELGTPITRIGVAYNGSDESRAALEVGRRLAAELGANALAFQALPRPVYEAQAVSADVVSRAMRELEADVRERLIDETGIDACTSCGDTVHEISIFSGSVDLLIVGSRDYGPVGRLVHGSTTHRLLGYARSPLLILTRGAREQVAAGLLVDAVSVAA